MVRDHGYGLAAPSNIEMNHQYGSEFRNGGQFNGVAPLPPPPPHHPPPYGGYFSGSNGQPPLPVSPPPPLPSSHPSSLFPVTTNSSPTIPPSSSYPQMPNASVMLLSWLPSFLEISCFAVLINLLLFGSHLLHN
jgi:YLP motif-containing protein 1